MHRRLTPSVAILAIGMLFLVSTRPAAAATPAQRCEKGAGKALASCVGKLTKLYAGCFEEDGAACASDDRKVRKALEVAAKRVDKKCKSDNTVQSAGYGPSLTVDALAHRIQAQCQAEADTLGARSFGGPHGAELAEAAPADRACMQEAHKQGRRVLLKRAKLQGVCVDKERKSGDCDPAKTASRAANFEAQAATKLADACQPSASLEALVSIDEATFFERVRDQAACMTAIGHPDVSPLDLDCGPRQSIGATPRGQYVQVVLDEAEWGTRCGDGSPYAFWIRMAPDGSPPENVVLQMQGGGVCLLENDCSNVSDNLLEALNDNPPQNGIMSNDPGVSPFANWTKVYLPYCTQDVFIGGGTTSNFPGITVHRFGGLNVRASLRYLREALWRELDASSTEGYRPDRVRMLFGGTSAGGFGTLYNYHYVLDDLQWPHTTAWPDASLAIDTGGPVGIAALGLFLTTDAPPIGWGSTPLLPPYCFQGDCGVGPILYETTAPRLKAVPEQQFLVLSNQVDNVQVNTTFFPDAPSFVNAVRQSYCDTAGLNGVKYFLPAITQSTHVISTRQSLFTGQSVDGVVMRDWLGDAMSDPDGVVDAVEEGTLVADIAGVNAFPCNID